MNKRGRHFGETTDSNMAATLSFENVEVKNKRYSSSVTSQCHDCKSCGLPTPE